MNKNIIRFYLEANKLKSVIRTGWKEVGISSDKIESVADHVYGCMALIIGLISEKDYSNLNLIKVFKMLVIKELTKANSNEQSVLSKEERKEANRNVIINMTNGLNIQSELVELYDESVALETNESKFVLFVSKLESDIQAKKYELDGEFTLDNALNDVNNYPEDIKNEVLPQVKNASDGWILFDRRYYNGDEIFESLSQDIQKLSK
jgi:5'-deoxynucleotidase YfbR-like HD superfamily hydrolase